MEPTGKQITAKQIKAMLERQKFSCAMTGRQLTPETATLDHITPIARGGDHALENLWIVHHDANRAKGSLELEEFEQLCREVVAAAEQRATTPDRALAHARERYLEKT